MCEFILDSQSHPPKVFIKVHILNSMPDSQVHFDIQDSDLVFEQECVDPNSWTYLDSTPISLMKTENELIQGLTKII